MPASCVWLRVWFVYGAAISVGAQLRQRARRSWCVATYVIGAVSVLFSCYWVWWILVELSKVTPSA